ncbi:MAG TPA: hypothetical protein VN515_02875 [Terriglobales bacterium]|nr:hypothetical protein [Terriglobales bacterium]
MRSTLWIEDNLMAELKSYAETSGLNLSSAANVLLRRGLHPEPVGVRLVHGFPLLPERHERVALSAVRMQEILDKEA